MRRILLTSALFLAACTQSPAGIVNRGTEGYSRSGSSGYNQPMGSISGPTYKAASVGSVSSGDLAPPTVDAPSAISSSDVAPPVSVMSNDVPPPQPTPQTPPAAPLYVDDTVPPASAPSAAPANPNMTSYETNPSHILGAVKAGTTTTPPSAAPTTPAQVIANTPSTPTTGEKGKFVWPVHGRVIQGYGKKADGSFNDGINIAANQGSPIVAAGDGEVVYSGSDLQGYGNMVIIRHANNTMTAYAHAERILVDKGEQVKQGTTIATVGKSGGVSEPQLHFGVRVNKEPVDPTGYLSGTVMPR